MEEDDVTIQKNPVLRGHLITVVLDKETVGTIGFFGPAKIILLMFAIQICLLKKENLLLKERLKNNPSICSRWS